ncbi:MAG: endonuclease/exonuclease/phosphatase family protein [Gemmatimonadota bacterium]|nr:MAG: endonuclease/exonuclease/phosphatase family protein [Gemmatimonadota bacterium]
MLTMKPIIVPMALLLGAASLSAQSVLPEPPADSILRIATWNIRNFRSTETDEDRVAQVLLGLDADLLAVQEIRDTSEFRDLLDRVNDATTIAAPPYGRRTRRYMVEYSSGGGAASQFLGFVFDASAVELSNIESLTSLQMSSDLRPSLAARVRSLRGSLDFLAIANHTDSGIGLTDYTHRQAFLDALEVVLADRGTDDTDLVILGDLNTMGHDEQEGERAVTAEEELMLLDERIAQFGLRRLPADPPCSEYYQRHGGLLDHVLVAVSMREVPPYATARIFGYCRLLSCLPYATGEEPFDYRHASDHCPVVVDLLDRDWD